MDLRTFISELDSLNLLTRVHREADWKYEIGSMTRAARGALLFSNIKDYPGYSILTGAMCGRELIAVSLGLDRRAGAGYIVKTLRERFKKPIEAILVKGNYPLHDNIICGKEVDLYSLPVPLWSEIDGGRFIGTWHLNITKDPEGGKRNVGVYRMQILSKTAASISVSPASHLALHMEKAESLHKPLEMAVCIGVSELAVMCAAAAFPFDTDEFAMTGALAQKPLELVKCACIDLEVPADSEIVLEGEIMPERRVTDGPYLDYAGVASSNPSAFLFEVKSITRRDNPVFRGTAVGVAGGEDHELLSILAKLGLVDFHGSRWRQKMQNACLKNGNFKLFQMTGRLGKIFH